MGSTTRLNPNLSFGVRFGLSEKQKNKENCETLKIRI